MTNYSSRHFCSANTIYQIVFIKYYFTIQGMHSNSYEEMQRISSCTRLFLFGTRLT